MSVFFPLLRRGYLLRPRWALHPFSHNNPADEIFKLANLAMANVFRPNYFEVPEVAQQSSKCRLTKTGMEVKLDVKGFTPEELDVKTVENCIIISGKHEEKPDEQGFISRSFVRRYIVPDSVNQENVTCSLSPDGILLVSVPVKSSEVETARKIPITMSDKPAADAEDESESANKTKASDGVTQ